MPKLTKRLVEAAEVRAVSLAGVIGRFRRRRVAGVEHVRLPAPVVAAVRGLDDARPHRAHRVGHVLLAVGAHGELVQSLDEAALRDALAAERDGLAMGLFWLSTVPLTSGLVAVMFGTRHLGTLFGIVFFSHQVGAFLGVYFLGVTGNFWFSLLLVPLLKHFSRTSCPWDLEPFAKNVGYDGPPFRWDPERRFLRQFGQRENEQVGDFDQAFEREALRGEHALHAGLGDAEFLRQVAVGESLRLQAALQGADEEVDFAHGA